MTIRELAETAGCSEKTVKRIVADKMPGKMQHGKVTRFSWEEAHKIMELLPKKNMVSNIGQMSSVQETNVLSADNTDVMAKIATALGAIAVSMDALSKRVNKIEGRIDERQALLPAPQISPRNHVTKLVREFAAANGHEHPDVWRALYREFGYRTNSNPSIAAKNRGMTIIDYIDAEGQIETLEAVAIDYFGGNK